MVKNIFVLLLACLAGLWHAKASDVFTVSNVVIEAGGEATIDVMSNFSFDCPSFYVDIILPEGLTLKKNSDGTPAAELGFSTDAFSYVSTSGYPEEGHNKFAAMAYDSEFLPWNGSLLKLKVICSPSIANGTVLSCQLEGQASDINGSCTYDNKTFNVTVVTPTNDVINYSNDYGEGFVDWVTSVDKRFTPVIMNDDINGNYLSVDQDSRYNNGCVLTSDSLQSKVNAGADFTISFDLKLGNSNNQQPVSFTVYDEANRDPMFSLTSTATYVDTWYVNGTLTQVTLPNSSWVKNATISNVTWITVKVSRTGKLTYLTITNKETGAVIFPISFVRGTSKTGGLGKMEFVTKRYMANFAIDNIVVRDLKDGDVPAAIPTEYTIRYVDRSGVTISDDVTVETIVGVSEEPSADHTKPIYAADGSKKYIYESGTTIDETAEDATKNIMTLTYREAGTLYYALNAVDNERKVLKPLISGTTFEQEELILPYPAFISVEGQLWNAAATALEFRIKCMSGSVDTTCIVGYTRQELDNIVFCAEAEQIEGLTLCENGNMVVRSSNAACAYATEKTVLTTLPKGIYHLYGRYASPANGAVPMTISAGDIPPLVLSTEDNTNAVDFESEDIIIYEDTPICLEGGNKDNGLDFLYIRKVADVELVNVQVDMSDTQAGSLEVLPRNGLNLKGATLRLLATHKTGWKFTGWTDADGNIVSTQSSYSFVADNDKQLTANFVDVTITDEEWQLLQEAYSTMDTDIQQKLQWDFSGDVHIDDFLKGVRAVDRHITEIYLAGYSLSGTLPVALFVLPYLERISFADNQLSGDIVQAFQAYKAAHPQAAFNQKMIDLSGNQFTGNAGVFAAFFPQLSYLDLSGNRIDAVYPMVSPDVTYLNLNRQILSSVVSLHVSELSLRESLLQKLPSLLLYDHEAQSYIKPLNLKFSTIDGWNMEVSSNANGLSFWSITSQAAYNGRSGDILTVSDLDSDTTFPLKLSFDGGDSNFDGAVNVLDLQSSVNYIMERYTSKPYNFTAANLWADDVINVQDIIRHVSLLMEADSDEQPSSSRSRERGETPVAEAAVYVSDGQLLLSSRRNVTAFDIVLSNAASLELLSDVNAAGITVNMKRLSDGLHVIGYTMSGSGLAAGITALGTTGGAASVSRVMLADGDATEITSVVNTVVTGISDAVPIMGGEHRSHYLYDLYGRKVREPQRKGLYIKNGRKYIK